MKYRDPYKKAKKSPTRKKTSVKSPKRQDGKKKKKVRR